MREILDGALAPLVTPELLDIILDCVSTLETVNYDAALDELNTVIMIADSMADSAMLVSRVLDIIRVAQDQMLQSYQIELSDEATMENRHSVIQLLLNLPNYIIPEDIQTLMMGDYDNESLIAHLVPMFSQVDIEEIYPLVLRVDDALIASLRSMVNEKVMVRGISMEANSNAPRIRLINTAIARIGRDKFQLVLELANSGVRSDRPMRELLELSFDALDRMNCFDAAYELFGLALFSNCAISKIEFETQMAYDEYTDNDMERNTMLDEFRKIKLIMGNLNEAP